MMDPQDDGMMDEQQDDMMDGSPGGNMNDVVCEELSQGYVGGTYYTLSDIYGLIMFEYPEFEQSSISDIDAVIRASIPELDAELSYQVATCFASEYSISSVDSSQEEGQIGSESGDDMGDMSGGSSDDSITTSDGTVVTQDGTVVTEGGTVITPDGTVIDPDGTITTPGGTIVDAEGNIVPTNSDSDNISQQREDEANRQSDADRNREGDELNQELDKENQERDRENLELAQQQNGSDGNSGDNRDNSDEVNLTDLSISSLEGIVIDGTTELPSCEELFAYAEQMGYGEDFVQNMYDTAYERYPELRDASVSQIINAIDDLFPNIEKPLLYKIVNCLVEDTPPTSDDGCTAARPEDLVSSDITETSAVLNWSDVQQVYGVMIDHYNVRYRPMGTTSWEYVRSIEPSETSIEITDLQQGTNYEWQARSKCADSSVGSDYKNYTGYFTTLGMSDMDDSVDLPDSTATCTAEAPMHKAVSNITESTVTLSWNDVDATHYHLRLRKRGTTKWRYVYTIKSTTTDVDNLESGTHYEWQVRSVITDCEELIASRYMDDTGYFKTSGAHQSWTENQEENQSSSGSDEDSSNANVVDNVVDNVKDDISELANVSNLDISAFALSLGVDPSVNFDLSNWKLNTDGGGTEITDLEGYEDESFFTSDDGGMTFRNCLDGETTENSSYTRSELRYLITPEESFNDPSNNFYLSTSSSDVLSAAGAIGGTMEATLSVDSVTTSSSSEECYMAGRIIIGQIHGSDNEMLRLYYHKLPDHQVGAIYMAHEPNCGDEQWINIVGNYVQNNDYQDVCNASQPLNGIPLGAAITYKITVHKEKLIVDVAWGEGQLTDQGLSMRKTIDMSDSCYEDDYLYFKAGVYSQNKHKGDTCDQVTFYNLNVEY